MDKELISYKEEVLDKVSPSFCAAKWYNSSIWLNSGHTTSCHHPPKQPIPLEELKGNPKAIHNTKHKKEMRRQMLEGIRPDECEYCWKIEDISKDHVSDRVHKSIIYDKSAIDKIANASHSHDTNLKTLEISFSRACNLACSYCNADYSTTWAKDINKNGEYKGLTSFGSTIYSSNGDSEDLFKDEENNPYIQAFWKWWQSDLKDSLEEIRITGGEPIMSPQTWKLMDFLIKEDVDMRFAINSNLMCKSGILDKLIDKSKQLKDFHLYTSMEATGLQADFIRDGAIYEEWLSNLDKFMSTGNWTKTYMMMTINALCLFSITDFMDDMLKLKQKHNGYPYLSLNILRFPSFQSALSLPMEIKIERKAHLKEWYEKNQNSLHSFEKSNILRLIDYLSEVQLPHARATSNQETLWIDFKNFYFQYAKRRNKSLRVFPEQLTKHLF